MKIVIALLAIFLIAATSGAAIAEQQWINNITVNEYNMTWGYTEIFTGFDSVMYRTGIASELGNNDNFITAWELLKLDREMRSRFKSAIDNELDVRINNKTTGIEVMDIDSSLSPGIIGNTNISEPIVNRYNVSYRFKDNILNATRIWFLGEAGTPVTIVLPVGIDVTNTSGISNVTKNISDHTEFSGFFTQLNNESKDRGEITLYLAKNISFVVKQPTVYVTNPTLPASEKVTKPAAEIALLIRDASVLGGGIVIILLIYIFKVRKR